MIRLVKHNNYHKNISINSLLVHYAFLSEIDPVGIVLFKIMISSTITVQQIEGGEGPLKKKNENYNIFRNGNHCFYHKNDA